MKTQGILTYLTVLIFVGWCAFNFRTDIAQIKLAPIWAARGFIVFVPLLSLANYALRMARWTIYLTRLGHPLSIGFSGLTYIAGFSFTLSPGKVGEMVRSRYYKKVGIPLSCTASAFFIERLMDLLAMITLAFIAVASSSVYHGLIWGGAIIIAVLMVVLAAVPWLRVSEYVHMSASIPLSLKKTAQGVLHTLLSARILLHPQMLAMGFIIGLLAWGTEATGLMLIGWVFPGVSMGWTVAVGIYSIATLVGALSFLPGGLGSTEAVMIALLAAHGYSMPDAMLLTLVCRLLTLWFAVAIGWIAVAALRKAPLRRKVAQ